jgi:hypothetical protein
VLLAADPLTDIENTNRIVGVMRDGRFYGRDPSMRSWPKSRQARHRDNERAHQRRPVG